MIQHTDKFADSQCKKSLIWTICWRPFLIASLKALKDCFCFTFLGTCSYNFGPSKAILSIPIYRVN